MANQLGAMYRQAYVTPQMEQQIQAQQAAQAAQQAQQAVGWPGGGVRREAKAAEKAPKASKASEALSRGVRRWLGGHVTGGGTHRGTQERGAGDPSERGRGATPFQRALGG